jgi:hypothetical protein
MQRPLAQVAGVLSVVVVEVGRVGFGGGAARAEVENGLNLGNAALTQEIAEFRLVAVTPETTALQI